MHTSTSKISLVIKYFFVTLFIVLCSKANAQFYNGLRNDFGKNRIQYNQFLWQFYKFERFDVYFYLGGKETALFTSQAAEKHINEIEQIFDYSIDGKIEFIVYNNLSDFKQSNIGLAGTETANVGGETRIVGSKVFIYFEGDHQKLEEQIRAGITEILIYQLLYEGSWREMARNSAMLHLPEWYVKGLIAYIAKGWNSEIENKTKDGVLSGKYKKLNQLYGSDAVDAGHAVWHYIDETFGRAVIPNIMYMTRVSRNAESGFLFVLGNSLRTITSDYYAYYQNEFSVNEKEKINEEKIVSKKNRNTILTQYKISPNKKYAVYSSNDLGKYKIYLYDIENKKASLILKGGKKIDRINDYSYPLIAWHPSSKFCSIVNEVNGEVKINIYNLEDGKITTRPPLFAIDKILDLAYNSDGKKIVMSATVNGQSDIFSFIPASGKLEPITKDAFDDLNPRFIGNTNKIVFSSNRTDDTIRFDAKNNTAQFSYVHDLFVYDLDSKSKTLLRLTNTTVTNERNPQSLDNANTLFISEHKNTKNLFNAKLDSIISFVDTTEHYRYFSNQSKLTDFSRNILEYDFDSKSSSYTSVFLQNKKYRLVNSELSKSTITGALISPAESIKNVATNLKSSSIISIQNQDIIKDTTINNKKIVVTKSTSNSSSESILKNYAFEGEKPVITNETNTLVTQEKTEEKGLKPIEITNNNKTEKYNVPQVADTSIITANLSWPPKQRNYLKVFTIDQVVSQLDNNFLNSNYQVYTGGEYYYNPGLNGLLKIGLSDVMEDHRIVGGFRLSADLRSNEAMLQYQDRSQRVDKYYTLYRQSFPVSRSDNAPKIQTHHLKYGISYPFSEVAALKGSVSWRNDRRTYLAFNDANLAKKTSFDNWIILKTEYVFDNTLNRGINSYNGTRLKLFAEYFNNTGYLKQNLAVLGFDVRNYKKIHRNLIWANRIAGSSSQGSQKLVYYLGGVDNWINLSNSPTFNTGTRVSDAQEYAFQAVATNMRGFSQNVRNGNNFVVYNSELRLPVFQYLLNRPMRSDFLNNFQLVGFGDVGSAWTGTTPWAEDNTSNEQIITAYPITVILQKKYSPFVYGYGWGMRSRLFGYFIRADWAYGFDDGEKKPRIFYLSFSLDF